MLQLLRANVGLPISLGLLAAGLLISTFIGLLMARSGASLRPIFWFAGFIALIVCPQIAGHFYRALHTTQSEAPRAAALERLAAPGDPVSRANDPARTADARSLFGPDADPQLISDVRAAYGEAFADAEFAQFAVLPGGETVLLARFRNSTLAEKAWVNYLRVAGLQTGGQGDSHRGYAVTRPVGDRAYALPSGTLLGVWTGRDDATIRARMRAGGFEIPRRAPLQGVAPGAGPAVDGGTLPRGGSVGAPDPHPPGGKPGPAEGGRPAAASPLRLALIVAAFAAYLVIVVLYFFKGSAWAGTTPARPGTTPVAAGELARRLEAVNELDVPFRIERGARPDELIATWRYADARWMDLARARGMKRLFRIRMTLDEPGRTVRATDYTAGHDWSAGRGGANVEWKAGVGIVFFQYEHRRVLGLQLDEQGRFKPELSYAYTFDVNEMKSPLVEAVTRAGWTWRPTVWQGPTWLRWLTE